MIKDCYCRFCKKYNFVLYIFFQSDKQSQIFRNDVAVSYADGVGVHWYWNRITPANFLRFAKTEQKDLFLLGTEASVGKFK